MESTTEENSTTVEYYIQSIKTFFEFLDVPNIFVILGKQRNLEQTVTQLVLWMDLLTFNIHSNLLFTNVTFDRKYIYFFAVDDRNLFMEFSNLFVKSHARHQPVIILQSKESSVGPSLLRFLQTDVLLLKNGEVFKCARNMGVVTKLSTVFDLRTHLSPSSPGVSTFNLIDPKIYFPLFFFTSEGKMSGLIGFFQTAFEEYYNQVRSRGKKSYFMEGLEIVGYIRPIDDGYPLTLSQVCFMLPILNNIRPENYILKLFKVEVWLVFLGGLVTWSIILRIFFFDDFFSGFMETSTVLMGVAYRGLNSTSSSKRWTYIQLFLFGIMFLNLYNSQLSSYLTAPDPGKILKTFDDIKKNNITVTAHEDLTSSASDPVSTELEQKLGNLYRIIPDHEIDYLNLDPNHGYLIPDHIWIFRDKFQKLLSRKIFSFSKICPYSGFIYPLSTEQKISLVNPILKSFTMKVQESGLIYIWEQFTYHDMKFHYKKDLEEVDVALGFDHFYLAWGILCVGLLLSGFVLGMELVQRK